MAISTQLQPNSRFLLLVHASQIELVKYSIRHDWAETKADKNDSPRKTASAAKQSPPKETR
jgi:hypothetical protein